MQILIACWSNELAAPFSGAITGPPPLGGCIQRIVSDLLLLAQQHAEGSIGGVYNYAVLRPVLLLEFTHSSAVNDRRPSLLGFAARSKDPSRSMIHSLGR